MRLLLAILVCLFLSACGSSPAREDNTLRVGIMKGVGQKLMRVVQNVASEKYGLHIKIVEFDNYDDPNIALVKGEIDVNIFQHQPFLIDWNARHGSHLAAVGKTFFHPMGAYSDKLYHLRDIADNGVVVIPDDVTNQARALLFLKDYGLIRLRAGANIQAAVSDVIYNPRHLQIKTAKAEKLAALLPQVDVVLINTDYALAGGLLPKRGGIVPDHREAIHLENKNLLYANVFVVRPETAKDPRILTLINAFHSPQVLAAAQILFQGNVVKAW